MHAYTSQKIILQHNNSNDNNNNNNSNSNNNNSLRKNIIFTIALVQQEKIRLTFLACFSSQHVGICEFPSKQFYGGRLQTADSVKSRDPSPVTFWPAQVRRQRNLPIVFCHVEGQEESSVISTSESNEESKRNMKEVRKAVCELLYPLISVQLSSWLLA